MPLQPVPPTEGLTGIGLGAGLASEIGKAEGLDKLEACSHANGWMNTFVTSLTELEQRKLPRPLCSCSSQP